MSQNAMNEEIRDNPKFRELVSQRNRWAWRLSLLVFIIYFGFIVLVAFASGYIAQPLSGGSVIPLGMLLGLLVIVFSCLLTGLYVYQANTEFDSLTQQVLRAVRK